MVHSQALRLVPGRNFSQLLQARRSASWTRSSASEVEPEREIAKARRFLISDMSSSLKLAEGSVLPLGLRNPVSGFEAGEQSHEGLSLNRASDGVQDLRVGRCAVWRAVLAVLLVRVTFMADTPLSLVGCVSGREYSFNEAKLRQPFSAPSWPMAVLRLVNHRRR